MKIYLQNLQIYCYQKKINKKCDCKLGKGVLWRLNKYRKQNEELYDEN